MFGGSSSAGAVAAGVACAFVGSVMLIWSIWDIVGTSDSQILVDNVTLAIVFSFIIWLWSWYCLHMAWKTRPVCRRAAFRTATVLIITGLASSMFAMARLFLS